MRVEQETTATLDATDTETISFTVNGVTGDRETNAEFQRSAPVGSVTQAIAARLGLSANSAWQLRSDRTSAFLDDEKPIAGQIAPGEKLTITPKAHLGGMM